MLVIHASVADDQSLKGHWWLPQNPDDTVAGTLHWGSGVSLKLEVLGALARIEPGDEVPVVCGSTVDGPVTLTSCTLGSHTISRVEEQSFYPTFAIVGEWVASPCDLRFGVLELSYTHLERWVQTSGLEMKTRPTRVECHCPDPLVLSLDPDVRLVFAYHWGGPRRNVRFEERPLLHARAKDCLTLEAWLAQFVRPVQDLLALCTGHVSVPVGLVAKQVFGHPSRVTLRIIFNPHVAPETEFKHSRLLLTAERMSERGGSIQKWLDAYRDIRIPVSQLVSPLYHPDTPLEQKFLTLAQAAEAYHRRRYTNRVLPKAQHRQRVTAIVEKAPEEYRGWLEDLLKYSNEPRLVDRLADLVGQTGVAPL